MVRLLRACYRKDMLFDHRRTVPADVPAFASLPVQRFAVGRGDELMAVHVSGRLGRGRVPLLCVSGYHRNMSDFADFTQQFHRQLEADWPVVLVDLKGRGRSSDRRDRSAYVSTVDAADLAQVIAALGIEGAICLGQGFGGQVLMALAAQRPTLLLGTILIDAGPVSDPRGLVRLRNNLREFEGMRSPLGLRNMIRRMLQVDYPAASEAVLDRLGGRTHVLVGKRVQPLFDPHLLHMLDAFEHDDVLVPQWPLFEALGHAPLMLMRTQLTEQLRRETFEEMMRRRRDADGFIIEGQGSPALLDTPADVEPIADFVRAIVKPRARTRQGGEPVSA